MNEQLDHNAKQTNGTYRGNALSDQPESLRSLLTAQVQAVLGPAKATTQIPPTTRDLQGRGWLAEPAILHAAMTLIEAIQTVMSARGTAASRATSRGEMRREYVMGPGHVEYFPTWSFWGRTFVRLANSGSVPTVVTINEDRFHLNPGEETTKDGQWAAFPIRVVNTIELAGSQVTVTVS